MKQTEWVNTATKAKPSKENRLHPIQVENQFEMLEVEDDINESESTAPESKFKLPMTKSLNTVPKHD